MKYIFTILLLFLCTTAQAYSPEQIAEAINKAENSKQYPYGIRSINTHGDVAVARRICLNTIRNNQRRFTQQKRYKDFIEFLGSRYCPTSGRLSPAERKLNSNWVKNVKYHLERSK